MERGHLDDVAARRGGRGGGGGEGGRGQGGRGQGGRRARRAARVRAERGVQVRAAQLRLQRQLPARVLRQVEPADGDVSDQLEIRSRSGLAIMYPIIYILR